MRTFRREAIKLISVLACGAVISGCVTPSGEPINLLSTAQELEIGRQLSAEVEKQEKLLDDAAVQSYVSDIGERLARVSTRTDVQYVFKVIDKPDEVNAFALPGGYMYLYTGLMKLCDNEAELAAVMAHEMGHVAARHHGESLTRQIGMEIISRILLGPNPAEARQILAALVGTAVGARFSRKDEREADQLGIEFLFRAGYDPGAMVAFMEEMLAEDQRRGRVRPLPIFATHPATENRMLYLQQMVDAYPLELRQKSPTYPERYQQRVLTPLANRTE